MSYGGPFSHTNVILADLVSRKHFQRESSCSDAVRPFAFFVIRNLDCFLLISWLLSANLKAALGWAVPQFPGVSKKLVFSNCLADQLTSVTIWRTAREAFMAKHYCMLTSVADICENCKDRLRPSKQSAMATSGEKLICLPISMNNTANWSSGRKDVQCGLLRARELATPEEGRIRILCL